MYRYEAKSVGGFVQQLAVGYVAHGCRFYVTGRVPASKRKRVDEKLIKRYGVNTSRAERSRRKKAGRATVHYLRFEDFFVLVSTHGVGRFMEDESKVMRDFSREPLKCFGYSIAFRNGHASVRIELEELKREKAYFSELATHRRVESVMAALAHIPYERYAPVRGQLLEILREVNRVRKQAGFEPVPFDDLWRIGPDGSRMPWLRRFKYRPFEVPGAEARSEASKVENDTGDLLHGVCGAKEERVLANE